VFDNLPIANAQVQIGLDTTGMAHADALGQYALGLAQGAQFLPVVVATGCLTTINALVTFAGTPVARSLYGVPDADLVAKAAAAGVVIAPTAGTFLVRFSLQTGAPATGIRLSDIVLSTAQGQLLSGARPYGLGRDGRFDDSLRSTEASSGVAAVAFFNVLANQPLIVSYNGVSAYVTPYAGSAQVAEVLVAGVPTNL
jgi:hypothetical protein